MHSVAAWAPILAQKALRTGVRAPSLCRLDLSVVSQTNDLRYTVLAPAQFAAYMRMSMGLRDRALCAHIPTPQCARVISKTELPPLALRLKQHGSQICP